MFIYAYRAISSGFRTETSNSLYNVCLCLDLRADWSLWSICICRILSRLQEKYDNVILDEFGDFADNAEFSALTLPKSRPHRVCMKISRPNTTLIWTFSSKFRVCRMFNLQIKISIDFWRTFHLFYVVYLVRIWHSRQSEDLLHGSQVTGVLLRCLFTHPTQPLIQVHEFLKFMNKVLSEYICFTITTLTMIRVKTWNEYQVQPCIDYCLLEACLLHSIRSIEECRRSNFML